MYADISPDFYQDARERVGEMSNRQLFAALLQLLNQNGPTGGVVETCLELVQAEIVKRAEAGKGEPCTI